MKEPPHYYSRLARFRDLFGQGVPILTYHHVGPRPAGVRLKGLYVSSALFSEQMEELRQAGFSTSTLDHVTSGTATEKVIFLTFDDGFRDVFEHALPTMQQQRFTGIQFLLPDLLGKISEWQAPSGEIPGRIMDKAEVRDWMAAGNQIGSHTLTHPRLSRIPVAQAKEEIAASKKKLEDLFGVHIDHFCYPYGDLNEPVKELVREAGYKTACTTRFGVNTSGTDPFLLQRVTARYRSRNLKNIWGLLPS